MSDPARYEVHAATVLTITVRDADAIERVTGPKGDEWRAQFYRLTTAEDVLEHWTYNTLINGVRDVQRLEGWADLAEDAVTIDVEYGGLDAVALT